MVAYCEQPLFTVKKSSNIHIIVNYKTKEKMKADKHTRGNTISHTPESFALLVGARHENAGKENATTRPICK